MVLALGSVCHFEGFVQVVSKEGILCTSDKVFPEARVTLLALIDVCCIWSLFPHAGLAF
jgi:hypothetical protein